MANADAPRSRFFEDLHGLMTDREDVFAVEADGPGLLIVERIVAGHDWIGSVESDADGTRYDFSRVERRDAAPVPAE